MTTQGTLAAADIWLARAIDDSALMSLAAAALGQAEMRVLGEYHHRFSPHGLTAVWILGESHCALHTYPEHNFLAVDCFTCGDAGDPAAMIDALTALLPVERVLVRTMARGMPA